MPPPMPNPTKRMTANPARPVGRYRPGKAVQEEKSSSEEDEEADVRQKSQQKSTQAKAQTQKTRATVGEEEDDDEEGFVTEEDDDDENEQLTTRSKPSTQKLTADIIPRPPAAQTQQPASVAGEKAGSKSEDEDSEEDSESEDSSSEEEDEEEAPQRKLQRPTFIKKTDRDLSNTTTIPTNGGAQPAYNSLAAASAPETDEQARRKAQAELLIKDKLERDLLARAAGKKAWDDDDEVDPEAAVDDTDGIDPKAEYLAWYLREVKRRKRDKEALEEREREIEERERRRNLSTAEREKEDKDFIDKQKEERDQGRGKANYLAKYHHKGAFFQDDAMAEILKKRDIMGAKFADEVSDKSILPEYMRVRDMTKLGKKGRTRYKDLKNEDTGRFGDEVKRWRGAGDNSGRRDGFGGDLGGGDERFMADDGRDRGPTGANASTVGTRKERRDDRSRSRSRSRSPKRRRGRDDNDDDYGGRSDSYRPRRRSYSRSRSISKSRSRSPRTRRKRSHSPDHGRDKRVRVEVA